MANAVRCKRSEKIRIKKSGSLVGSAHICLHQILLKNPLVSFGLKPKSKPGIGKKKNFLFFG